MPTYLDTSKIQATGRLALSPAALRNLKVSVGDSVEIFFDESTSSLIISPIKISETEIASTKNSNNPNNTK